MVRLQCYSLATIGYRVAIFNDCEEASEALKQVRSSNFVVLGFVSGVPFLEFFQGCCCNQGDHELLSMFFFLQEIKDARVDLSRKGFKFD